MTEEFLHYIWKNRLISTPQLHTEEGEPLHILRPGIYNTDEGPDFFDARIRIGETLWAGNVEIHLRASDWVRHGHQQQMAYQNIILHVVYENDTPLLSFNGEPVPALSLKGKINTGLYNRYITLKNSRENIPCGKQFTQVEPLIIRLWLDRLLVERLEKKIIEIKKILSQTNNDWNEAFYRILAKNFGFKTNSLPFEMLARSLSSKIIAKHKNNLFQLEALLFGQAGLLGNHFKDKYPRDLQNEYVFLSRKYGLNALEPHLWKFMRMRPVNFPSIRIAQFASLIFKSSHLLSRILETKRIQDFRELFSSEASDYWKSRYRFDKASPVRTKILGADAIENLLINTISPFLFAYGRMNGEETFVSRSIQLLEELSAEKNSVTRAWVKLGYIPENATGSQALIQLKNNYCNLKRCLHCTVGNKILSPAPEKAI